MQLCPIRSCGLFGSERFLKYDGAPTTAMRMSGPDPHRDHVLRHLLAASHAGVIALGDDVGQAVVDDDLDLDVGIVAQELGELRQEDRVGRIFGGRDPDGAGGLVPKLAQRPQARLRSPRTAGPAVLKQALAGLRRRDAARRAGQQADAEPGFELADGVAQRRLRNAKLRCRLRETALPPDRDERPEGHPGCRAAFIGSCS